MTRPNKHKENENDNYNSYNNDNNPHISRAICESGLIRSCSKLIFLKCKNIWSKNKKEKISKILLKLLISPIFFSQKICKNSKTHQSACFFESNNLLVVKIFWIAIERSRFCYSAHIPGVGWEDRICLVSDLCHSVKIILNY